MKKKILITGAGGYLGGRISYFLSQLQKYEIILLTTKEKINIDGNSTHVEKINWAKLKNYSCLFSGVDVVLHLAGMNSINCSNFPELAMKVNVVGTAEILQMAIENSVKRIIYFSTAHVYKDQMTGTISENTCTNSFFPYASSHKSAEDLVRFSYYKNQIEGVIIRLSNAYGMPVHKSSNCWSLVVNDFCKQAVTKKKIVIKSQNNQIRDFIAVTEVCRAVEHLIEMDSSFLGNGIFNLGGGWSKTIIELANIISKQTNVLFNFYPEIIVSEKMKNETKLKLNYCINKLIDTGYVPRINYISEINNLLQFCKKNFYRSRYDD